MMHVRPRCIYIYPFGGQWLDRCPDKSGGAGEEGWRARTPARESLHVAPHNDFRPAILSRCLFMGEGAITAPTPV